MQRRARDNQRKRRHPTGITRPKRVSRRNTRNNRTRLSPTATRLVLGWRARWFSDDALYAKNRAALYASGARICTFHYRDHVPRCSFCGNFDQQQVYSLSRESAQRLYNLVRDGRRQLESLNERVLNAMESPESIGQRQSSQAVINRNTESQAHGPATTTNPSPYRTLDFSSRQIRLLELHPTADNDIVCGFRYVELSGYHPYTALSYTWGDETARRNITIDGNPTISIRENLWSFLRLQSSHISENKLFWIDAICINQSNVHERNHQVNLMKQIYANASEVYVWLGAEADNSDLAMDFVANKGARKLRPKGLGFHPIWTVEEGRALYDLCDRVYWRRMWIIQEIVHANRIAVWCGSKSFKWHMLESLYLTLKALEDTSWFAHHKYAMQVLQSSACVMVWQRAHWRHPDTPAPRLQALIEIFRSWQCADVRDKVYALVGMASPETAIVPDYSKTPLQVFGSVQQKHGEEKHQFYDMLSQLLALPT